MEKSLNANRLKVELDVKKGRSLTSTDRREPGDIMFQDRALATCVVQGFQQSTCHFCLKSPLVLRRCSVCKRARYCDELCQKRDWCLHSAECELCVGVVGEKRIPSLLLLLVRLLKWNKKYLKVRGQEPDTFCEEIEILGSHENIPESTKEMFSQYVQLLMAKSGSTLHTTPRQMYRALGKLYTNTFSVMTEELVSIAAAVYPIASLMNHSCRPNCVQHFSGSKITIRAIDRVEAGEELTMSYIDVIQGVEERRDELSRGYLFRCECKTCLEESIKPSVQSVNRKVLEDILQRRKLNEWENILEICQTKFESEHKTDYDVVRILEQLMDANIELGKWKEAVANSRTLSECYREIRIANSYPCVALNTVKQAKLLLQLDRIEEAMECIERGISCVKLCYGCEGGVYRCLSDMYSVTRMQIFQKNNVRT
eukprot:TRINITY_DN8338_c0_g1_i1.p1 TRINITY_DN8338_c0_g1~~TRINITY_DN8338_c0_g1_i1.p1  ORF type:complete len:427 (+),score=101.73 TRINITY_DN8338_c0_g1_i1:125-1405(+)